MNKIDTSLAQVTKNVDKIQASKIKTQKHILEQTPHKKNYQELLQTAICEQFGMYRRNIIVAYCIVQKPE